jgi:hypothetical protein
VSHPFFFHQFQATGCRSEMMSDAQALVHVCGAVHRQPCPLHGLTTATATVPNDNSDATTTELAVDVLDELLKRCGAVMQALKKFDEANGPAEMLVDEAKRQRNHLQEEETQLRHEISLSITEIRRKHAEETAAKVRLQASRTAHGNV